MARTITAERWEDRPNYGRPQVRRPVLNARSIETAETVHVFAGERLMLRTYSLIFLAAIPLVSATAQIQGIVVDPSSRPAPNATIECAGHRATTDAQGRFSIDAAAPCEASISSEGFETARVKLEPGKEAHVLLSIARLSERVVVSATRTPTTIEESGVSATVFTRNDIADRDYPAVPDLLRDVPGVDIAATGRRGAVTSMFTRGGQSTATLILLDGMPLNEPGGQLDLSGLTTTGIDRYSPPEVTWKRALRADR
jgi:outer membrane receptor protein involved in Fe transport